MTTKVGSPDLVLDPDLPMHTGASPGFDAAHSESYKTFRLAMGDRLLPNYEPDGSVFVYKLPGVTQACHVQYG